MPDIDWDQVALMWKSRLQYLTIVEVSRDYKRGKIMKWNEQFIILGNVVLSAFLPYLCSLESLIVRREH